MKTPSATKKPMSRGFRDWHPDWYERVGTSYSLTLSFDNPNVDVFAECRFSFTGLCLVYVREDQNVVIFRGYAAPDVVQRLVHMSRAQVRHAVEKLTTRMVLSPPHTELFFYGGEIIQELQWPSQTT